MKAYKVFKIENGKLCSAFVERKAKIIYSPHRKSRGKSFLSFLFENRKKIRLPIFAFKTLTAVQKAKKELNADCSLLNSCYEIWEVKGKKSYKKFYRGAFLAINKGIYYPMLDYDFPRDTIFLSTCIPIKKIE